VGASPAVEAVVEGAAELVGRQQVNPLTGHQAGLSLSAVELEEALALIAAAAFLQGQHKKALEDWSYWRIASTAEQIQQDF
jgi:hypothetical protein